MILFILEVQFFFLLICGLIIIAKTKLRYKNSREVILNTFCYLQGRNTQWIRDPTLAKLVLASFDSKGSAVEKLLSSFAWFPILSLESVDEWQWRRMKRSLQNLFTYLPPQEKLTQITGDLVQIQLNSGQLIDNPALVRLVVSSMVQWLFDRTFIPEWEFVVDASLEWRKEIAIKGQGNMGAKLRVVEWMKDMIFESKYYPIFGNKWNDPEYYSLILQPFLISPAINISDIAVILQSDQYLDKLKEIGHEFSKDKTRTDDVIVTNEHIICAINFSHPFPILERWISDGLRNSQGVLIVKPNTQAFIPLDEMGTILSSSFGEFGKSGFLAFGAGKRACAGRDIALALCLPLFSKLINSTQFQPRLNHVYSGRNNDGKENWSQSLYQIKILVLVTTKLLKLKFCSKQ